MKVEINDELLILACMFGTLIGAFFFGEFLFISFQPFRVFSLSLTIILLVSSLTMMILTALLLRLEKRTEILAMREKFLNAMFFVASASLFGFVLSLLISHVSMIQDIADWRILHIIGATVLFSLFLIILVERKTLYFLKDKKQEEAILSG